MRQSTQLYRRLLSYALRYKVFFFVSLVGFVLYSAMETALIKMVDFFIEGLQTRDSDLLIFIPIFVIVVSLLRGLGHFVGAYYISRVGLGVVNDLRKTLFESLVYLPNSYYDQRNSSEFVSIIIYNIQQVTGSVTNAVKTAMREGLLVIALLGYMFYTSWLLTLSFIVIAPVLATLVFLASRYFRRLSRKMQTSMGGITHIAREALQGYRTVRSFIGQPFEIDRFNKASDQNTELNNKYQKVSALQAPVFQFVLAIDIAVILFLVLLLWDGDVGEAVAYLTAAAAIAKPIRQLSTINESIQKGLAAAESIFDILDKPREGERGNAQLKVEGARIEFRNLCFSYASEDDKEQSKDVASEQSTLESKADTDTPSNDKPALRNINLCVEPGQTLALVGRSGSGKSTLTHLLMGFYQANSGQILIDGQDIAQCQVNSLRENIALVNQQTILFNDSISKNIAYAQKEIDVAKVKSAAEHASAAEFIEQLPEAYDTLVGEDGARLSGGQKQRIAIARALFKDAPILVLDEATSALDTESEKSIQKALLNLQKGRTTLIVAHRLSTIEHADKIVVLDQGAIVESGSHQELLAQQGLYWSLYTTDHNEAGE